MFFVLEVKSLVNPMLLHLRVFLVKVIVTADTDGVHAGGLHLGHPVKHFRIGDVVPGKDDTTHLEEGLLLPGRAAGEQHGHEEKNQIKKLPTRHRQADKLRRGPLQP